MNLTHIRAEDLEYPVLFIQKGGFDVWSHSGSARSVVDLLQSRRQDTTDGIGLLVDCQGRSYNVVDAEDALVQNGRYLSRDERRRLTYTGITLICEGETSSVSVDEARRRIAWIVSARGHFESATGFGLPTGFSSADSVAELLQVMVTAGFRR